MNFVLMVGSRTLWTVLVALAVADKLFDDDDQFAKLILVIERWTGAKAPEIWEV